MCSALPTPPPCPATLLPQINKEALRAQTNSTGYTTFERLIPVEAMFIVSGKVQRCWLWLHEGAAGMAGRVHATHCLGTSHLALRLFTAAPPYPRKKLKLGPPCPVPPAQIFNFAMSNSFTSVDFDRLQFPAQYKVGAADLDCSCVPCAASRDALQTSSTWQGVEWAAYLFLHPTD